MIWLTSLPTAVPIICGLGAALLFAIGARLAVRALIPTTQRESAYTIAAPLMTALGGLFALTMAFTLVNEAGFAGLGSGDREQRGRRRVPPGLGGDQRRS